MRGGYISTALVRGVIKERGVMRGGAALVRGSSRSGGYILAALVRGVSSPAPLLFFFIVIHPIPLPQAITSHSIVNPHSVIVSLMAHASGSDHVTVVIAAVVAAAATHPFDGLSHRIGAFCDPWGGGNGGGGDGGGGGGGGGGGVGGGVGGGGGGDGGGGDGGNEPGMKLNRQ